jgi:isopenicillin-N N-acyltransferase-like protein
MSSNPIPVLEFQGSFREVGLQIGQAMKPTLERKIARLRESLLPGVTWREMLHQTKLFVAHSRETFPDYLDEIEGIAHGSGLPLEHLFMSLCEVLWEPLYWQSIERPVARKERKKPSACCTDFAARGRATQDGSTLLAHTNDLSPEAEDDLAILRIQAGDEPEFLGVSVGGLGFSAGVNAAGIGLTGNELHCNDVRPGIPRMLTVRAILGATRLGEAVNACLLPGRESSYNNIIADANGEVFSMEGSATDCEPIYIEEDILAHANHYISAAMRVYEAHRNLIGGSILRHHRAFRLLRENYGKISPQLMMSFLADHANYPESICKHEGKTITVFSIILQLETLQAWIGRGRPCETLYVEYQLEPWIPPQAEVYPELKYVLADPSPDSPARIAEARRESRSDPAC